MMVVPNAFWRLAQYLFPLTMYPSATSCLQATLKYPGSEVKGPQGAKQMGSELTCDQNTNKLQMCRPRGYSLP